MKTKIWVLMDLSGFDITQPVAVEAYSPRAAAMKIDETHSHINLPYNYNTGFNRAEYYKVPVGSTTIPVMVYGPY